MVTRALTEERWASVLDAAHEHAATLTVADLADVAGYSPFHFSRVFSAHVGIGPGQYLTALRIDAAKRLLLADPWPVVDVAAEVGFDSLSSFSRRFRDTVGVPPAHLRRLADRIGDRPPRPFTLPSANRAAVHVVLDLPTDLSPRADASVWVGWYPQPAPIGLPRSGVLVSGRTGVDLSLCDGAPFLLGFAVAAQADPLDQLVPSAPVVAAHPLPVTGPGHLTLHFGVQKTRRMPMLSALPSLYRS